MFILHRVLPHVHHEHEGFEHSISHIENQHHSHENDHHHDDKGDDDFDFLDFLLGNHVHSIQGYNIAVVTCVVNQQVLSKDISNDAISDFQIFLLVDNSFQKSKFGHAPPDSSNRIYLSTSFLRGPPSLG